MEHRLVDDILSTFPIAEFARLAKMNEAAVRLVLRQQVIKAILNGGSIDNMRKVMEYALVDMRKNGGAP